MLIKKESRIYSYIDEYGDERLYSINEYLPEDEYLEELMFSDDEDEEEIRKRRKKNRHSLENYDSSKGIKRTVASLLIPGGGVGAFVGRSKGEEEANRADKEGASDAEILRRSRNAGAKRGAIVGAGTGAALGIAGALMTPKYLKKVLGTSAVGSAVKSGITGGIVGYLGGRNSTSVQTKARLKKRKNDSFDY